MAHLTILNKTSLYVDTDHSFSF